MLLLGNCEFVLHKTNVIYAQNFSTKITNTAFVVSSRYNTTHIWSILTIVCLIEFEEKTATLLQPK